MGWAIAGHHRSRSRPTRLDRRAFLVASGAGLAGLGMGSRGRLERPGGRACRRVGSVDDPVLPLRRGVARRHLGPEARRAGRVPRAVPAGRDDGARGPALRAPADAGPAGASPGRGQLGRRDGQYQRPPRRVLLQPHRPRPGPELQDARQRPDAPARRLALHGLRGGLANAGASAIAERDHAAAPAEQGARIRGPASSPRGWGSSTTRCMSTATSASRCASSRPP